MDQVPEDPALLASNRLLPDGERRSLEPGRLEHALAAPPPEKPTRPLSRRSVLVGLGLAGMAAAAGEGIYWWVRTHPGPLVYRGHTDVVSSVAWSPDGKYIASASWDKTVQILDASTGARLLTYRGHQQAVIWVDWAREGTRLVSNEDWDAVRFPSSVAPRSIHIWEASSGRTLLTREQIYNFGSAVVWSPDSTRLASAGVAIEVWDATSGATLLSYNPYHLAGGVDASWSPDGQHLAVAGDRRSQAIDAQTGAVYRTYDNSALMVWTIAWSPNGQDITSAGITNGHSVQVWDASTGSRAFALEVQQVATRLAWSPNSQRLASANTFGLVYVWDALTGKHLYTYTGHQPQGASISGVNALAWSPDGTRIASGGGDHTVQVCSQGNSKPRAPEYLCSVHLPNRP